MTEPSTISGEPDRLSKLLLCQGHVYEQGKAWTVAHDQWLRRLRAAADWSTGTRLAFDTCYETVATVTLRRERLDAE